MTELKDTVSATPEQKPNARGTAIAASKLAKLASVFEGKRFRVVRSINEDFLSPLGNRGSKGWELEEIGNETNRFAIGETALRKAATLYGSVDIPVVEKKPRGRPRKVVDTTGNPEARPSLTTGVTVAWE